MYGTEGTNSRCNIPRNVACVRSRAVERACILGSNQRDVVLWVQGCVVEKGRVTVTVRCDCVRAPRFKRAYDTVIGHNTW